MSGRTFRLSFTVSNAAFDREDGGEGPCPFEIANVLERLAHRIRVTEQLTQLLHDVNGNRIGTAQLSSAKKSRGGGGGGGGSMRHFGSGRGLA